MHLKKLAGLIQSDLCTEYQNKYQFLQMICFDQIICPSLGLEDNPSPEFEDVLIPTVKYCDSKKISNHPDILSLFSVLSDSKHNEQNWSQNEMRC